MAALPTDKGGKTGAERLAAANTTESCTGLCESTASCKFMQFGPECRLFEKCEQVAGAPPDTQEHKIYATTL